MLQNADLSGEKTEYVLNIPGRLRIRNEAFKSNKSLCSTVMEKLTNLSGIQLVSANPYTGKVLIIYDPEKITMKEINTHVNRFMFYIFSNKNIKKLRTSRFKSLKPLSPQEFANCHNALSNEYFNYTRQTLLPVVNQPVEQKTWHTLSIKDIEKELDTDLVNGLTNKRVQALLEKFGINELEKKKTKGLLPMLLSHFDGFTIKLLLAAAGLSLFLGQTIDAVTILVIIAVEAVLGIWQEYKAERSLKSLEQLSLPAANVIREGRRLQISANQVVPGDVITLEAGGSIPADARLIESYNLEVMESSLTGESCPVLKAGNSILLHDIPLGDRVNMVYMGTSVVRGNAKAVVVSTGMNTELGKVAGMLNNSKAEKTPLQKDLNKLASLITMGCLGICTFITIGGIIGGQPLIETLATGVSLAVGAIPEGLTTILVISMAFSAQRMIRKNTIVKTLPSIETLSCMKVICTDKTGTLTKNEMTVKSIYTWDGFTKVTGSGYNSNGTFEKEGINAGEVAVEDLKMLLAAAALCNNSEIRRKENNTYDIKGDPTEAALLIAVEKSGVSLEEFKCYKREHEIPFDSSTKKMITLCSDSSGQYFVFVKGAIDTLLQQCTKLKCGNSIHEMNKACHERILDANEKMAGNTLRVLGFAYKQLKSKPDNLGLVVDRVNCPPMQPDMAEIEEDLIFLGLAGVMDPPRPEVEDALKKCRNAGIRVVMITGDHKTTAASVAQSIGLLAEDGTVISGDELENMSDGELAEKIENVQVFARTCPEQKLKIVKAFMNKGHIVAMTGDGVNDAPALKEAHIGIAMGKSGTDIAKEAASIILANDDFSTVVQAVEEGRTINRNVKKFIKYVLTGNFAEVLTIFLATITGSPSPLLPAQILLLNLVTEGIPALSLGLDPPEKDIMNEPSRDPLKSIFDDNIKHRIITRGIATGITTLGIFAGAMSLTGNLAKARTMAFANLVSCQMLHAFECSSIGITRNKYLFPAVVISAGVALASIYISPLNVFFGMTLLSVEDWLAILLSAFILSRIEDFFKDLLYIARMRQKPSFGI
jgi:Ca2+-transporting ATPase